MHLLKEKMNLTIQELKEWLDAPNRKHENKKRYLRRLFAVQQANF